ncbi:MAG: DUF4280 domain-containing protein [Lachnospiraceae bacterium]|nr:DUF4280 domain-containing protein [Lachnospiraceae bacterium]
MGLCVTGGAMMTCTFGMAPSTFNVLPTARVMSAMPLASIMDNVPLVNIMPFGMCTCMANPTVAAATAAALGVLTPMPCIPVTTAPWTPGVPQVLVGGKPALNNQCKLLCSYGGMIQFTNPGCQTIQL